MRVITFITFILILLHSPVCLHAQIVNIESARIQTDTTGWAGSGGTGISLEKNTRKIFTVNLEAHVQYKTQKDLWLFLGDHSFLKGGNQKFVSNTFAHFRYNRKLNPWLRWEVFTQLQNNVITQIKSRFLTGTGPRFKIMSYKKFRLYAASLIMYEHEQEKTFPAITHNDIRSSSYISFTFVPNDNVQLVSTTFYQPLLKNFSDVRIYNQVVLIVKASDHLSFQMKWNYLYDHNPAGIAPKTNYHLISGLNYEFAPRRNKR